MVLVMQSPKRFKSETKTGGTHYEITLAEKPSSNNQKHRVLGQTMNLSYLNHPEYETSTDVTGREYRGLLV